MRVTKIVLSPTHPDYTSVINELVVSKQLYNSLNYLMRQQYLRLQKRNYADNLTNSELAIMDEIVYNVDYPFKSHHIKKVKDKIGVRLHSKVTQSLVNQLAKDWKSFFALKKNKTQTNRKPPNYKTAYNSLQFNKQTVSKPSLRKGVLKTYLFSVKVPKFITYENIQSVSVRIDTHKVVTIHVVYNETTEKIANIDEHHVVAGIDLGLKQFATITFNDNYRPLSYSGEPLLTVSHNYARLLAKANSHSNEKLSHQLWANRHRKMEHLLRIYSNRIVDDLIQRKVGRVIIGYNQGWKNEVNLGRKMNQKFYSISHLNFINKLTYKLESLGIAVELTEESYTSKASFMDNDELAQYGETDGSPAFSGKRVQRGMYKCNNGYIHADVNGSYNIMRKVGVDLSDVRDWLKNRAMIEPIGKRIIFN